MHASRAERARMPLAREVVRQTAIENGVCIRPVSVRKVDRTTGAADLVDLPCGATLASKCPSCAERARRLRIAQCREGWHLENEPIQEAEPATAEQRTLATVRADLEAARVDTDDADEDPTDIDAVIGQVDELVTEAGVRGRIGAGATPRRVRSTRRRQDVADLPRRRVDARTVGRVYGERFRPSLFVTATSTPTDRSARMGRRSTRTGTTTSAPPATRSTSPGWSTGSCRTCADSSAGTCSTSPPSSRSAGSRRTSTWRCGDGVPGRAAAGRRRDVPPGVVAAVRPGRLRRRPPGLGRRPRGVRRPGDRGAAVVLG